MGTDTEEGLGIGGSKALKGIGAAGEDEEESEAREGDQKHFLTANLPGDAG